MIKEFLHSCYACKMEPNYEALTILDLRTLAKYRGLRHYSKLQKADLISLLRFDAEESDNKVDDPKIKEKGAQFDPEKSDKEEDSFFDDPKITEQFDNEVDPSYNNKDYGTIRFKRIR